MTPKVGDKYILSTLDADPLYNVVTVVKTLEAGFPFFLVEFEHYEGSTAVMDEVTFSYHYEPHESEIRYYRVKSTGCIARVSDESFDLYECDTDYERVYVCTAEELGIPHE